MKIALALGVCAVAAHSVAFAAANVDTSVPGQVTITVGADDPDYTLQPADVTALGANNKLIKDGMGRLIISTDIKAAYDGEIEIVAGYLRTTLNGALGGTTKGTVVKSGGTLEIEDNSTAVGGIHSGEPITFEGTGVGGHGAIYVTKAGASVLATDSRLFSGSKLTMTGDATVGYSGDKAFDGTFALYYPISKCFDMGKHTLTIQGGSNSGFYWVYSSDSDPGFVNQGNIVLAESCRKFTFRSSRLGGSSANTFTVMGDTSLVFEDQSTYFWQLYQPTPWTLILKGNASFDIGPTLGKTGDEGGNGWCGPIRIEGSLTVNGRANVPARIHEKVSGPGGITVASGTLKMQTQDTPSKSCYVTNDYTGVTLVKSGATLIAKCMSQVPCDHGQLVVEDGGHVVISGPTDPTATSRQATDAGLSVMTNSNFNAETADVLINASVPVSPFTDPLVGPMTFGSCYGPAAGFELASSLSGGVAIHQNKGTKTTVTTGGEVGRLSTNGGAIDIAAGATVNVGANGIYSDGIYPEVGRISVHGTLLQDNGSQAIDAGRSESSISTKSRGIFEMFSGSSVTAHFNRNCGSVYTERAQGSYFIHGGTVQGAHTSISYPGDYRCGYLSIEGDGQWFDQGETHFGRGGTAIVHVRGGFYKMVRGTATNIFVGGDDSGSSDFLVENGGQFIVEEATISFGQGESWKSRSMAIGIVGEGSLMDFDLSDNLTWTTPALANCDKVAATLGILDGGTLRSPALNAPDKTQNSAFVYFDRGTYRTGLGTGRTTMFKNFTPGTDAVLVGAGGATLQTDYDYAVGASLDAPSGNGIASIDLPAQVAALGAWEYIAAPRVEISDPTGVGAAAIAVFDTTNGLVTGFRVICPGINYTSPTVKLKYGGYTSDFTFTDGITLAPNVSGGLTKTGAKTLTVDQVCSYMGPTTVAAGTLKLGADDVIKTSSGILMAGGTLDVNNKSFDLPLLGGCGTIRNAGNLAAGTALSFKADDLAAKKCLTTDSAIALAEGAVVSVDDLAALAASGRHTFTLMTSTAGISGPVPALGPEFAGGTWSVYLSGDGKSLKLNDGTGFALIVR